MATSNPPASPIKALASGASDRGWPEGMTSDRRQAIRFQMLSLVWIFPSLGALVILGMDFAAWATIPGTMDRLRAVPIQSWIALALLLAHLSFLFLARRHRRRCSRHQLDGPANLSPDPSQRLS